MHKTNTALDYENITNTLTREVADKGTVILDDDRKSTSHWVSNALKIFVKAAKIKNWLTGS